MISYHLIWYIFHDVISSDLDIIYQSFSHFLASPWGSLQPITCQDTKLWGLIPSFGLIPQGAWQKNRKGGNLDGIHISKSLSFDVLGVGIGELLRDGVQTTSHNLNRWHRTNSSTSSGTGMDALKTLDKQPLGHKNKRKMIFMATGGKMQWFFSVKVGSTRWNPTNSSVVVGFTPGDGIMSPSHTVG